MKVRPALPGVLAATLAAGAAAAGPPGDAAPAAPSAAPSFEDLARVVAAPNGPREITLERGTYRGDLVIKRPLVLHGAAGGATTLEGTGAGTVLTIESDDVTVDGVHVRHSGRRSTTEDAGIKARGERVRIADVRVEDTLFGISLAACQHCVLERAVVAGNPGDEGELRGDGIKLWESHGSVVRGCTVDHMRDVVVWYTRNALLEDNVIRHSRYGTHFMYAHDGVVRRSRVEGNVVGIFVMYSQRLKVENNVLAGAHGAAGMGLGFKESDAVEVRGNWLVANTTGTYLDFTPRTPAEPVIFDHNVFALDDAALRLHAVEKGVSFTANEFRQNAETVEVDGGGDALSCDVRGNHFSDYEGYDLNGDGIGDVPYRVNALSSRLSDDHPAIRFFAGTPAMQLIDAMAHAVPVLESRTLMKDDAPLVSAPEVPVP